jgi:amidohydrolase
LHQALKGEAEALFARLASLRQYLHAHPELSGQEVETAACVAALLVELGLAVRTHVGRTGVVAMLAGRGDDPRTVAVRVDMDALPLTEQTDLMHRSRVPGVMHACGHDLHTTVGLGAAMVLAALRDRLPGRVKFLFQPAEETAQGARWMVDDGALTDPPVSAIFGLHCFPNLPMGAIGVRHGVFTAAADALEIEILGRSGHGARPHEAVDAIWVAANAITALQQGISRMHNPLRPVVLSIGQIEGGTAPNIISDRVVLRGTVRSLDPQTRAALPEWIERIVSQTANAFGARHRVDYRPGTPSVVNDPALTTLVERAARAALGDEAVHLLGEPSMGAEDFAVFCQTVPGTMFRLGVGRPGARPLHHPAFDCGDEAIVPGVVTLCASVLGYWGMG